MFGAKHLQELVGHVINDVLQASTEGFTISDVVWKDLSETLFQKSQQQQQQQQFNHFFESLIHATVKQHANLTYSQFLALCQYLVRLMRLNGSVFELDSTFHNLVIEQIEKKEILHEHIRTGITMLLSRDAIFRAAFFDHFASRRKILVEPDHTPLYIIMATFAKHYPKLFFEKISHKLQSSKKRGQKALFADLLYQIVARQVCNTETKDIVEFSLLYIQRYLQNSGLECIVETVAWQSIISLLLVWFYCHILTYLFFHPSLQKTIKIEVAIPLLYTVIFFIPLVIKKQSKAIVGQDGTLSVFVNNLLKILHRFINGAAHGLSKPSTPSVQKSSGRENAGTPPLQPVNEISAANVKQKLILASSCVKELLQLLYLLFPCSLMRFLAPHCHSQVAYYELVEVCYLLYWEIAFNNHTCRNCFQTLKWTPKASIAQKRMASWSFA